MSDQFRNRQIVDYTTFPSSSTCNDEVGDIIVTKSHFSSPSISIEVFSRSLTISVDFSKVNIGSRSIKSLLGFCLFIICAIIEKARFSFDFKKEKQKNLKFVFELSRDALP